VRHPAWRRLLPWAVFIACLHVVPPASSGGPARVPVERLAPRGAVSLATPTPTPSPQPTRVPVTLPRPPGVAPIALPTLSPPPARVPVAPLPPRGVAPVAITTPSPQVVPQGIIIPGFRVIGVTAEAHLTTMDTQRAQFGFTGRITVSGRGIVKYRWLRCDGAIAPVESVVFEASGTKEVTSTWLLGRTDSSHEQCKILQVEEPNSFRSNEARFTVPALGFRVTRVEVHVRPQPTFDGVCPTTFEFTAAITVEGTGVVKYRWVRSDGGKGPVKNLIVGWPGTISPESEHWKRDGVAGSTSNGWMNIEILFPNPMYPPDTGAPSAVYGTLAAYRYTMTCRSSSTPSKVELTGWSAPPTAPPMASGRSAGAPA
jgi:hypothetical protein